MMKKYAVWIGAAAVGLLAYFVAPALPLIGVAIASAVFFLAGFYASKMKM